ncbi:uncharacterized protein LOC117787507 [Drosophila innubila]|uniref:uncharacterized protein LOC117787507 n=1 Tax=Drosophila innubila TaxID=198719 RepID=UPI00148E0241|nr:uncharacterized protein LOC117787507 [Drosophila innubila]
MECINFNDFSVKERHEIITAFLIKMRKANSMQSAHSFFEYYLKQFYKMPAKLIEDIIYCQRAMKTYLSVHQRISRFYYRKTDADSEAKKRYLLEIEDVLHEINAECKYMVICLEDDIEQFCLPFTEQQLQPNGILISEMVSKAIVPHVCASPLQFRPHFVAERPTESQLLNKYLITSSNDTKTSLNAKDESAKPTRIVAPNKKPLVSAATNAARPAPKQAAIPISAEVASKNDAVNASRLHLQEALKRARSKNQILKCEPKAPSAKELFLHSIGLCTHLEHKSIMLSQTLSHKRKPKPFKK